MNKRVVYIRSNPVNPDSRVEKQVGALVNAGYNVTVLGWDRESDSKVKKSDLFTDGKSVQIVRFGIRSEFGSGFKSNIIPLIKFQIAFGKWLISNRQEYDIIHASDFDTGYTVRLISKILKKKYIYDIFDYYVDSFSVPNILKSRIEKMETKVINSANAVIICTEERKEQIHKSKPKKLFVIHNTPPKVEFLDEMTNYDKVIIVYVGILQPGRMLKELAEIVVDNALVELHIGGFGKYDNYFKDLSKKYKNIKYYGKISYDKTLKLESTSDILTAIYDPEISNHKYAAPNKFYEALMLGKPLIMIEGTGMSNIVSNNNFGEVIKYNKESLNQAIITLISKKAEWQEMSTKMKLMYDEQYSWSVMEQKLLEIYKGA